MSWSYAGAEEPKWHTIVPEPAPLAYLVIDGNGKDLDLEVALEGGRRLGMAAAGVAVSAEGQAEMHLQQMDDLNLRILYDGPGLEIRSMQICFLGYREEEYIAELQDFLAADDNRELGYIVSAKIALAAVPAR